MRIVNTTCSDVWILTRRCEHGCLQLFLIATVDRSRRCFAIEIWHRLMLNYPRNINIRTASSDTAFADGFEPTNQMIGRRSLLLTKINNRTTL
jgi:hypothetical protein